MQMVGVIFTGKLQQTQLWHWHNYLYKCFFQDLPGFARNTCQTAGCNQMLGFEPQNFIVYNMYWDVSHHRGLVKLLFFILWGDMFFFQIKRFGLFIWHISCKIDWMKDVGDMLFIVIKEMKYCIPKIGQSHAISKLSMGENIPLTAGKVEQKLSKQMNE